MCSFFVSHRGKCHRSSQQPDGRGNYEMSSHGNRSATLLIRQNYNSSHQLITPHLVVLLVAYFHGYAVLFVRCYFLQLQLLIRRRTLSIFLKWCFQPTLEKSIKKQGQNYLLLFCFTQREVPRKQLAAGRGREWAKKMLTVRVIISCQLMVIANDAIYCYFF
jgi:hypothetical protein